MKSIAKLFILLLLAAATAPASAADHVSIVLSDKHPERTGQLVDSLVFPLSSDNITVQVSIRSNQKIKAGFAWYTPDGNMQRGVVRLIFPNPGTDIVSASDTVNTGGMKGWWTAEVSLDGETHIRRFLITYDEKAIAVGLGGRLERLSALETLTSEHAGYEDVLEAAALSRDPETRAAAVSAAAGMPGDFPRDYILRASDDTSATVRSSVADAAALFDTSDRDALLWRLVSDGSDLVRRSVAGALAGRETEQGMSMLGRLIADEAWLVREAALAVLSDRRGDDAVSALAQGAAVDDQLFKVKVVGALSAFSGPKSDETLEVFLDDIEPQVRLAALKAYTAGGRNWKSGKVLLMVEDPDESVAMAAFGELSEAGHDEAAIAALRSTHGSVRLAGLGYAMDLGGETGSMALDMAAIDPDGLVRRRALDGFKGMGGAGVKGLIVLMGDSDLDIRRTATHALVKEDSPEVTDAMLKAVSDEEASVRAAALGYLAGRGGPENMDIFEKASSDPSPDVRRVGLEGLSRADVTGASRAFAEYYENGDATTRINIVEMLSGRGGAGSIETLRLALMDPQPGIRTMAVKALDGMGFTGYIAGLALDPDQDVRRAALEGIKRAPEPGMVGVLREALKDPDPGLRSLTIEALEGIEGPDAGQAISGAVADGSLEVRSMAGSVLLGRRDLGAAVGLAYLLGDPDERVRQKAADALAETGGPGVDEMVYERLLNGAPVARALAIDVLRRRGSPMLEQAVTRGISDPDYRVRSSAKEAAESLAEDGRARTYVSALSSAYPDVRLAGVLGLAGLRTDSAVKGLVHALSDEDPRVRLASLETMEDGGLTELYTQLPVLVTDRDHGVAVAAVEAAERAAGLFDMKSTLTAAANGTHRDVAEKAVDIMIAEEPGAWALPVYESYFKAGYRRGDIVRAASTVQGDAATEHIGEMYRLSGTDEDSRLTAVRALTGRGRAALAVLIEALGDPSAEIRREAVRSISQERDTNARSEALGVALSNSEPAVRSDAIEALSGMDDPGAYVAVLRGLNHPGLKDRALSRIVMAPPDALTGLASSLGVVEDAVTRAGLVTMLAGKGLETGMFDSFFKDPSGRVRMAAADAVIRRGGVEGAYGLFMACSTGEAGLAEKAVEALSRMAPEDVEQGLYRSSAGGAVDPYLLGLAAESVRDAGLLERLAAGIDASDGARLGAFLYPLIARHTAGDVPAMIEGLKAEDAGLRADIIDALAGLEPPDAEEAVGRALDRYPELGELAINAASGDKRRLPVARAAYYHGEAKTRAGAIAMLNSLPCGQIKDIVAAALEDPADEVRMAAVSTASGSGCEPELLGAAADASPEIRAAIASALGGLGGKAALSGLSMLAVDTDERVSSAAVRSLSDSGQNVPDSVWASVAAPSAPKKARLTAIAVLGKRKSQNYADVLAAAVKDEDPRIADAGSSALVETGPAVLATVHALMGDGRTRRRAIRIAGEVADQSSEAPLLAILPSLTGDELLDAVNALGTTGGDASLAPLAGVYRQGDSGLRLAVVKTLTGLRAAGSEPELVNMLDEAVRDESEQVRFYAARAVGLLHAYPLRDALNARRSVEESPLVLEEIERSFAVLAGTKSEH